MFKFHYPQVCRDVLNNLLQAVEIWSIPSDIEGIKHVISEEDYLECKSVAMDIMEYWGTRYPQVQRRLEGGPEEDNGGEET